MKKLWIFFWVLCLLIAAILGWRLWDLRFLYLDHDLREKTRTTVETIAAQEGWLFSDISLRVVGVTGITIHHQQHIRGRDPKECLFVTYEPVELFPCAL